MLVSVAVSATTAAKPDVSRETLAEREERTMDISQGFPCRECGIRLGTAEHYGLEAWQWVMLVGELRWIIQPTVVFENSDGTSTRKEGWALCDKHRHLQNA
jgi:hypothetical protein